MENGLNSVDWVDFWEQCQQTRRGSQSGKRNPLEPPVSDSTPSSATPPSTGLSSYHLLTPKKKAPHEETENRRKTDGAPPVVREYLNHLERVQNQSLNLRIPPEKPNRRREAAKPAAEGGENDERNEVARTCKHAMKMKSEVELPSLPPAEISLETAFRTSYLSVDEFLERAFGSGGTDGRADSCADGSADGSAGGCVGGDGGLEGEDERPGGGEEEPTPTEKEEKEENVDIEEEATALPLSEEHKLELPSKQSNLPSEKRESDPPLEQDPSDASSLEFDSDPLSAGRIYHPVPVEGEFELSSSESSQSVASSTATIIEESLASQRASISVANKTMQVNFCSVHQTFVALSPPRDRAASDASAASTQPELEDDEAARRRRRGTKRKMELMAASLGGYMLKKQARR